MNQPVIVSAARTPIAKIRGTLKTSTHLYMGD